MGKRAHIYRREQPRSGRPGFTPPPKDQVAVCRISSTCQTCPHVGSRYQLGLQKKLDRSMAFFAERDLIDPANKSHQVRPVPAPKPFGYRTHLKLAVRPVEAKVASQQLSPEDVAALKLAQKLDAPIDTDRGETGESGEMGPAGENGSLSLVAPPRFSMGLFQPGTHEIVEIDNCPLHVPALKCLIQDLRPALEASSLQPYDEGKQTGDLRYIAARAAHKTGELLVTFVVTNTNCERALLRIVRNLQRRGHKIQSANVNIQADSGNAIFGAETKKLTGASRLREHLCDLTFEIGPTSFFQVNPWQATNVYRRLEQVAGQPYQGASTAWDLYCGTGQIGLILARAGYSVLGIEENADAVRDAESNAKRNGLEDRCQFYSGRVEDIVDDVIAKTQTPPSIIVVNPSRRGLAADARVHLANLLKAAPQTRLAYVSCEAQTLARDLAELSEFVPSHRLRQLEAFDMFPQTDHLEWLAIFSR